MIRSDPLGFVCVDQHSSRQHIIIIVVVVVVVGIVRVVCLCLGALLPFHHISLERTIDQSIEAVATKPTTRGGQVDLPSIIHITSLTLLTHSTQCQDAKY